GDRHFNYCLVTEARPIVACVRMALRGQSFLLWSFLVLVLSAGCAGRGEVGTGQGGQGGTGPGNGGVGGSVQCPAGQPKCGSECRDLSADQQNCGTCGNACGAGQTCQAGNCMCSAGLLACGGSCVSADATHCGGCTNVCPSGQVCSSSTC